MKMLFGVGLVVLILGLVSFFVPYPQRENHGIKVGDAKIGVQTEHIEKVPVTVSAILLLGGAGMMIAGRGRS